MKRLFTTLAFILSIFWTTGALQAQVTIGGSIPPVDGALLDLKENGVTTKGLGLPRVAIKTVEPEIGKLAESIGGSGEPWDEEIHAGMIVYNTETDVNKCLQAGIYVWNGKIWEALIPITEVPPLVEKEKKALMALYKSTGGDNWSNKDNWGTDQPLSTWSGITTAPIETTTCKNGRVITVNAEIVTQIYFARNGLIGAIPKEIGDLTNMTKLSIVQDGITSLPEEIGNLTNLTEINLLRNSVSSLPESIGNLINLEKLDLDVNGKLASLPSSIGNLKKLTKLNIRDNKLTSLPSEIGDLTNMTELFISENELTSLPESMKNLTKLEFIETRYNQLRGTLPNNILNAASSVGTSFCPQYNIGGEDAGFNPDPWTNWDCSTNEPK